jgi:RHS repeat-associated protein
MTTQSEEGGDVRKYRYDANGNRIARVISADNSEESSSTTDSDTSSNSKETADYYYYDYEGRLIEIVLHNGKVFAYGYDGEGNRLWRTYSQYPLVKPPVEEGEQVDDPATFPGYNKDNVDSDTSTSNASSSDTSTTSDASSSDTTTDKKNSNSISENETQSSEDVDNSEPNTNNTDKDTIDDSSTINDDTENVDTNTDINSNIGTSASNNNNFIISNADLIDIENEDDTNNELVSMLSIQIDDELVTTVDSYLSTKIIAKTENSNGNGNGNGNSGDNGNSSSDNGNSSNNGNGNNDSNNNGNGNSNNDNSNKDDSSKGNGNTDNSNGKTNDKDKGNNSANDKSDAWKDNGATIDQEKANGKTKQHSNSSNGYDKNLNENGNGYAYGKNKNKNKNNNGKNTNSNNSNSNSNNPNTSDEVELTNPEIFEVTNYINDINQEYTQVLMTTDIDGNYRGAYTYANGERISVEDLGQVEGVPNDPLYYLYDALGSTIAITNMNAGIIDNNRFAPYGEALSPVAKNSRLTNSPWGYTGESHDIEAGLVYLRARYYEPGTGRFIQQDSYPYFGEVQKPLTRNLYIYGNANPMIFTDPGGNYSVQQDKVAHEQFQNYFKKLYGKSQVFKAFTDFPIYKAFLPSTITKKADLVLAKRGTVEVYEIEAYNKSGSGRSKLNSNVKGLKDNRINAIKGTTYKRLGDKLRLSYPGNSKKQIEYYTKPNDPGMIYYKIVNKEKAFKTYVTADQLKEFGWRDTSDEFVQKLNKTLIKYGITDKNSIALFMATMAEESGWGTKTIEGGSDVYFAEKKYKKTERGAGYIQITWRDTHLEFLKSIGDNFTGANTAKYISENYPMEAAAWFWSNAAKTGEGNLNTYVKKNGGSLGIFLITQYFVNALVTDENGNVPKAFMDDLTFIRQGGAFKITNNSLIVNGNTWKLPTNLDSRKHAYDKAVKAFK